MKKVLAIFAGLMLMAALVSIVFAQNTGSVTIANTISTLQGLNNTSLWDDVYDDQSTYPHQEKRNGTIIRVYDFSKDGGAVSTISLERGNVVSNVPDNTIIVGGFVDVITACLANGVVTNQLGVNTAGDLVAASTNYFLTTGVKSIIPDWESVNTPTNTFVKLTNQMPMNLTIQGNAFTQGQFVVYLDCYFGQ